MVKRENKKPPKLPTRKTRFLVRFPPEMLWPEGIEGPAKLPNLYEDETIQCDDLHILFEPDICPNIAYPPYPLNYIAIILETHSANLYPPRLVMDWLAQGFERYFKAGGTQTLDECLGFIGGRGKQNFFADYKKIKRDRMLCRYMAACRKWWAVSIEEAASMVASLPDSLSQGTLSSRYKRDKNWKAWRNPGLYAGRPFSELGTPIDVLNKFSYESLPTKLLSKHHSHLKYSQ